MLRTFMTGRTRSLRSPTVSPQHPALRGRVARALLSIACLIVMATAPPARGQQEIELTPEERALVDRPISGVEIEGLQRVTLQEVLNTIRTSVGSPYDPRLIRHDLQNLWRLGDFRSIDFKPTLLEDGTVLVTFVVVEQPILLDVQVVGNRALDDLKLLSAIPLRANAPHDDYLVQESIARIKNLYRDKGYYRAEVEVDKKLLEENHILIFRIIEGPRVRVRVIEFRGNQSFSRDQVKAQIRSETYFFLLRKGRLDEQVIDADIRALDSFYKDRGYLDVRIGHEIQLSPDDREAKIIFLIEEGDVFTMRDVQAPRTTVFDNEQISGLIEIKPGDVYSKNKIDQSRRIVEDSYGELGYIDVRAETQELRVGPNQQVDLLIDVREGPHEDPQDNRYFVGEVLIGGNFLTKDKVMRRHLPFAPGRPISTLDLREAERKLRSLRLFRDVRITPQQPDSEDPRYRDILVEIEETNTGSLDFGVAFGSDQGAFLNVGYNQRNFDIADFPQSFEEFIRQRAFRGAGQTFTIRLEPGNQVSRYAVSFTEPWFLERPISLSIDGMYRDWQFIDFDEERLEADLRLGRRAGDIWSVALVTSFKRVQLTDIEEDAPTEIFEDAGPDNLTALGFRIVRSTVGTRIRPGRGSVLEFGVDQFGAMGGDATFTKLSGEYTLFLTLDEDFLGRKTILRLNNRVGYIVQGDNAPTYEQFYLGGRSFRGFDFRTVSPKGIRADTGGRSDEPVGGEWLFFLGAQYEFPMWEETINGVFFVDSGTVTDDVGFDDYRVSVGFGLRLYIDFFGPNPLAFDLGFPLRKADGDEVEFFSFSIEIPF